MPWKSTAVAPDGSLWMLDKWGYVWVATASGDDYSLDAQPLAYVGPGRPLGFHFTANGDLAICNSLSVGGGSTACLGNADEPLALPA